MRVSSLNDLRPHFLALLALAALAVAHTWPLAGRLDAVLPGLDLGDNVSVLWNLWWMREVLAQPELTFFFTPRLFAPDGVPLLLHTHLAPAALAAATALGGLSLPAALNVIVITAVFLNGASAYALAHHVTRRPLAALLAGVLFLLAPPLLARTMGHFNLLQAWTLVLAVWLCLRMTSAGGGAAAGATAGLVLWTDYYLFVFLLGVIAVLIVAERWRLTIVRRGTPRPAAAAVCALLAVLLLAVAIAILASDVTQVTLAGIRISLRSADNPLMAMWVFAIAAAVLRWPWQVRIDRPGRSTPPGAGPSTSLGATATALAALLIVALPLIVMAIDLGRAGGYVTQQASWRTAPRGVDPLTLVLGPPFHPLVGESVRAMYRTLGIDVMESSAWLGISTCVLAWLALRRRHDPATRPWAAVAAVSGLWALGPFLVVAGFNTALILPQQLLRFVPVLGNARMPGRSLIVVSLAGALLAAIWAMRRPNRTIVLVMMLAIAESIALPLATSAIAVPDAYRALAGMPPHAVLELPFGYRDGFGETGAFDDRTLLYQTVHRQPIAGGFVARLPPAVRERYERDPVLAALAAVSAGQDGPVPGCDAAVAALQAAGIGYIAIDRAALPPLLAGAITSWPLEPLAASAGREVFRLRPRC